MMVYDPTNHSYVITFAVPQLLKVKCNDNVIRAAKVEIFGLQEVERIGRSPERVAAQAHTGKGVNNQFAIFNSQRF